MAMYFLICLLSLFDLTNVPQYKKIVSLAFDVLFGAI
jgi:hypothetical protein